MNELNRREFLKGSSALLTLASFGLLGMDFNTKSGPLKVALIGAGWYGKSDLFRLIQVADVEVVALCDVDKKMLTEAGELVSKRQKSKKVPELFEDYRELLQSHACDLVVIGSPDHWHALQAIEAMKSGAHVYLQKPISVDVIEGEAILAAARKYKRKCQIGTQRKSTPHLIEAKKRVIDSGLLGKISHSRQFGQGHDIEIVQEMFGSGIQGRSPRYVALTHHVYPIAFLQLTHDSRVHGHAAYLLDVAARYRLTVSNDGQRLHHGTRVFKLPLWV